MNLSTTVINKIFKNAVIIFVYHDVSNKPSHFSKKYNLNISPDVFLSQVRMIKKLFNVISPIDLINRNFDRPAALFTFDDGFKSYFNNALPILEEFNCPSINFINYDVINGELFWPSLVTYLCEKDNNYSNYKKSYNINIDRQPEFLFTREKIIQKFIDEQSHKKELFSNVKEYQGHFADENDLKKSGKRRHIFLGSHLYKHLNCTTISKKRLTNLLDLNLKYLSRFSNFINFFAYPFGQPKKCFNSSINNIMKQKQIIKIFSSSSTINFDDSLFLFDRIALNKYINYENDLLLFLTKKLIRNNLKNI